jgi:sugar lactone lactonase YvrE
LHTGNILDAGSIKKLAGGSGRGYKDGPALEARFDHIGGVQWDDHGNLYVADIRNNVIRKLDKNGRGAVPFLLTTSCSDLVAKEADATSCW